jgi:hypothetical protein
VIYPPTLIEVGITGLLGDQRFANRSTLCNFLDV